MSAPPSTPSLPLPSWPPQEPPSLREVDRWTEPARAPFRAGLGASECAWCGTGCLAIEGFAQSGCEQCLRVQAAIRSVGPAPIPVGALPVTAVRPPARGAPAGTAHQVRRVDVGVPAGPRVLQSAILVPDWSDVRVPAGALRLATAAADAGRLVRLTYALAELPAGGRRKADELVHTLCIRVWTADRRRLGYAAYHNGAAKGAVLWLAEFGGSRRCSIEEFKARVSGQPWTAPEPAAVEPCPDCGKPVRWTQAGKPYKHSCTPDLQS